MADTEAVLTLPDFLAARYDEAEAKALAAARVYGKDWHVNASDPMRACVHGDMGDPVVLDVEGAEPAEFIAAFDPRSVLADIAAKRKILELHRLVPAGYRGEGILPSQYGCRNCHVHENGTDPEGNCKTVRLLGEPFAGHPEYREEWKA